ncbi:hypothetical protein PFICI_00729 [Pestalotiopsis fici W106-1]|uniref:Uncharacterized protein n=1 Tax=Pestalotiopsis fici (strain W106-1 / CGMCC3.15140) TaxID=1229662 RepID=W3XNR2_PESFW|nr:uncharacterized protein PFICI_00729 [Pestalotiopsis fici W106-1]ETS86901.1 hypothetical protein PFICI_00729 [Pestalotiopsis fici W106-1]
MYSSLLVIFLYQALPVLSFPTALTHHDAVHRDLAIPILDLSVIKRSEAATASEAKAGEATTTNRTAAQVLAVGEEFKEGVVRTVGVFGSANPVQGGNLFTKMKLPANAAGAIEAEYNGTAANTITVAPKMASIAPPAGLMYVDPLTFTIATATPPAAGDIHQVDYIFGEASSNAVDVSQATVGKFDAATGQFVTEGLGELEFEAEENEVALKVADMNGEWAIFVPTSAVKAPEGEEGAVTDAEDASKTESDALDDASDDEDSDDED